MSAVGQAYRYAFNLQCDWIIVLVICLWPFFDPIALSYRAHTVHSVISGAA